MYCPSSPRAKDAVRLAEILSFFALAGAVVAERFGVVACRELVAGWCPLTANVPASAMLGMIQCRLPLWCRGSSGTHRVARLGVTVRGNPARVRQHVSRQTRRWWARREGGVSGRRNLGRRPAAEADGRWGQAAVSASMGATSGYWSECGTSSRGGPCYASAIGIEARQGRDSACRGSVRSTRACPKGSPSKTGVIGTAVF